MTLESVPSLVAHARQSSAPEAATLLNMARSIIADSKLEMMGELTQARASQLETLKRVKAATAYAVGSGRSTPSLLRLHGIMSRMPSFDAENGIRAALPAFEFVKANAAEISTLLKNL